MPRDTGNGRSMQSRTILASSSQKETIGKLEGVTEGYAYRARLCNMIKFPLILDTAEQPNSKCVTLLLLGRSKVNADLAGSVTNLVFSPSTGDMLGDGIWFATATEKAKIWT